MFATAACSFAPDLRNDTGMSMGLVKRCRQDSPLEGLRVKTSLLQQSCETPIIGPSGSNRLSRRVGTGSGSTIRISISFALHLRFNRFRAIGARNKAGPLEDPFISAIAARVGKTPAQVLCLGDTAWHGFAYHAAARRRISTSPPFRKRRLMKSFREDRRQRFNEVV